MGTLYSKGMSSTYWARVDMLAKHVYNKDINVFPYMPDTDFVFVDYYPELYTTPAPTALAIYINNQFYANVNIVDVLGTIYFTRKFPYGNTKVTVRTVGGNELKTYDFLAVNTYLYYELCADGEDDRLLELLKVKGDLVFDTVRDESIYDNFGSLFNTRKPDDFSYTEYRDILDSFRPSFLNGSTEYAIKTVVHDITGVTPTITGHGSEGGWVARRYVGYTNPSTWKSHRSRTELVRHNSNTPGTVDYINLDGSGTQAVVTLPPAVTVTIASTLAYQGLTVYVEGTNYLMTPTLTYGEISWLSATPSVGSYYFMEYDVINATQTHNYAHDIQNDISETRAKPGLKVYSSAQKNYTIDLEVGSSLRTITAESVIKAESFGGVDSLNSINLMSILVDNEQLTKGTDDVLNYTPVLPTYEYPVQIKWYDSAPTFTVHTASEGASFTVSHATGQIYWIGGVTPATSANYYATYKYGSLVVTHSITTYTDGIDYFVDREAGSITWSLTVSQPAKGDVYTAAYRYHVKDLVEGAVEQVKPAHLRVIYDYLP